MHPNDNDAPISTLPAPVVAKHRTPLGQTNAGEQRVGRGMGVRNSSELTYRQPRRARSTVIGLSRMPRFCDGPEFLGRTRLEPRAVSVIPVLNRAEPRSIR